MSNLHIAHFADQNTLIFRHASHFLQIIFQNLKLLVVI